MNKSDAMITWDQVLGLMDELKRLARGLLAKEQRGGSIKTTGLVLSALHRLKRKTQDWDEVNWKNQKYFFGAIYRAMHRVLIDHAKARARRPVVNAGNLQTEFTAPLVKVGALNLDNLVAWSAPSEERAEAFERILEDVDAAHPRLKLAMIVQHYCFGNLNQREIGELLGVSADVVRKRLELGSAELFLRLRRAGLLS